MATIQVTPVESAVEAGTPRYPPVDSGIVVATPKDILASQADLIKLLRRNLGLPDADFERRYLAPLLRAAELVNLLPATSDDHHIGAGGLFRFAATLAVRASQSAEGRIFAASEAIERRRQTEDAWRHAAFLTGLTCELFRPLTLLLVVDDQGRQWTPFVNGLTTWAQQNGSKRFYVRWHKRDEARSVGNSMASWAVSKVIGDEILGNLQAAKPLVVEALFGVASGAVTTADNNTLYALINEVRQKVIQSDRQIQPQTYGKMTSGSHLEPYFLDGMRTLLRKGVWQVNTKGARCHYGADGFYVAWKTGAKELLAHLAAENIVGVPAAHQTLLEMMGSVGIIKVASDGSWVHMAHSSTGDSVFPAILLQSPSSVLGNLDIKPVAQTLKAKLKGAQDVVAPSKAAVDLVSSAESPKGPLKPSADASTSQPRVEEGPPEVFVSKAIKVAETIDADSGEITTVAIPVPVATGKAQGPKPSPAKATATSATAPLPKSLPPTPTPPPTLNEASATPKLQPNVPRGAIVADEEDHTESEVMDKALLLELGSPICKELAFLRDKWNKGVSASDFLRTSDGIGMSYRILNSLAIPLPKMTEALDKAGFLHSAMISGKKRQFYPLPFSNGEQLGIVILTATARKAGFTLE